MRSTANVMSPSVPLIFSARSSAACRSACVWVARGSGTSTSCVVNVAVSFVSLIVYVPGRTRGPNAAPNAALAAARLETLRRRTIGQKRDRAGEPLGRQRPQRRDVVDDPDPASVRPDHEVMIARMDREIAHRDGR